MDIDKELVGEVIDQSSGVLEKAYDDLAHPTAKSLGNTLSLLPRTVGIWLGKWEKWVINGEESIRLTADAVREKAEKIPEEKLTEPEAYVAVPAIQQLSYCYNSEDLREMYANLLVSSMNTDTKQAVHPSFVDIIKQLTPDEAKILKKISDQPSYIPLIDLQVQLGPDRGHISMLQNYTNIGDGTCEYPQNICAYIENLDRLKLVCILDDTHLIDKTLYAPLENSQGFLAYKDIPLAQEQKFITKQKSFYITAFGKTFIKTCLK